ncbi:hypothetical protein QBC47DRAFT_352229 [Echria macrotheca]|uniref:AMP-activated protein kinase glycogen-binding domain-containing protein n=1 Tax=Echria macrotheca TaxID=438768 RepID=A0AAJ0B7I7_9PEZI|nr:hypothetical protein QBC47DRAFT_352229 [Echria macrotheca]
MATFTFKWAHDAEEVYVTGTFDNWTKSEQLDKVDGVFQKTVTIPNSSEKVYYKFVVDGEWKTDHTAPQENDHEGNLNNVLLPENMVHPENAGPAAAILNTVTPESTTAKLAGGVPLEKAEPAAAAIDTVSPESTTAQLAGAVPVEDKSVKVTAPGGYPETPAADLDKELKISPLPAANGAGALNPIKLAPGEKIPDSVTTGSVTDNVTLDQESYEKSDRIPGLETELPPITKNMIPESSLPILGPGDVTINTVTPESTTAALAGKVPLQEPEVPEVVKKSQEAAKVDPEASGISEEVKEKAEVEAELLGKVPEAPSTAEGTAGKGTDKSENDKTVAETVAAVAASASAAFIGAAFAAKETAAAAASDAAAKLPESAKEILPASVQTAIPELSKPVEPVPQVPVEVKESIQAAGESPEAAANAVAVEEKKEVEAELLKEVKAVKPIDETPKEEASKAVEEPLKALPPVEAPKALPPAEEPKPEEAKPEPAPAETNGTTATAPEPAAPAATTSETTTEAAPEGAKAGEASAAAAEKEKKKKNRLSAIFSKLKHKISDRK